MCHDSDSSPPIPAISGAAVTHRDLVLEASDGNRFAAFAALPDEATNAGIVVLPDVRGLYRFYEELALRFAERGHAAVAIDYFGRTAGLGKRDDDFEYMPHVEQTTQRGIQSDVAAAVGYLRSPEGGACTAIFTVGFCFGGRNSWLAAASDHGLAGAIGFYGRPGAGRDGSPGPSARAEELAAPLLALMGGDDPGHPGRGHHRLRRGAGRRRCRPRGRRLPGCSAQLLRPQARGVRRSIGGCLGARAPFIERHARRVGTRRASGRYAVLSPSSFAIGCMAATTFAMCSSSSRPRSSAPA